MRSIQSSSSCDSGFTLIELIVASFLGLLITGLCLGAAQMSRSVLGRDMARTRVNQNLRGALTLMANDGKLAGENLGASFPAIEIIDGTGTNPDELITRRGLLDEVLPLCATITANSHEQKIFFAVAGNNQGCVYSSHVNDYSAWRDYRLAHDNSVEAFIFDTVNKAGEFFEYIDEADNGSSFYLKRAHGAWSRTYTAGAAAIYLLEEWQYRLRNGMLEVVQNRDIENPLNASFNISSFFADALLQDGTVHASLTKDDQWTDISRIRVQLAGSDHFAKKTVARTVSAEFFPRNVLSH